MHPSVAQLCAEGCMVWSIRQIYEFFFILQYLFFLIF